jgi:putative hydrolase of the HAD superfamily
VRAVIFDLWDTLVEWPVCPAERLKAEIHARTGMPRGEFDRRWEENYRVSQTGTLERFYRTVGIADEQIEANVVARLDFARAALRLRTGAADTLAQLQARGYLVGLITNCSQDVALAWPETELAGLFDAETFSATFGLAKPDPEIYLHTAEALGVPPAACFFVGDGANDELAGAARVGMTPVLLAPGGEAPWPEVRDWDGLRVSSIPEVLELC